MSGKTGTSEKQVDNALIADYGLFVGWGPNPNPEYVAVVVLEEAGFGGQVAAPVIRRYFERIALGSVPAYLSQSEKDELAKRELAEALLNSNANDVTEYVLDIDSRLKALNNEKIALEEIKKEATSTSDKLQVQAQLRYINQDIEMLQGQKEYYEKSTSYSTLTLEIREGSGVSLFSWNYYVQRALSWIETIIGISISLSIVIGPLMLIYFVIKKTRNKN